MTFDKIKKKTLRLIILSILQRLRFLFFEKTD